MPQITDITINQAGKSAGVAGESRDDADLGVELQFTAPSLGAGTYDWLIVLPIGSSASPTDLNTNTAKVIPDIPGKYLAFLIFNGTLKSYDEDTFGAVTIKISSQGGAGVKYDDGRLPPTPGETFQFSDTEGWAGATDDIYRNLISVRKDMNPISGAPFRSLNFQTIGGAEVYVTNSGTGVATVTISGGGGGGGSALEIREEGVQVSAAAEFIDFAGPNVTATSSGLGVRVEATATGGAADALSTTGAAVDVSAAPPPTAGQALVATSATTATWQAAGGVQANVTGGLEFVDEIEGTADTTTVTFGTGGNGLLNRALDGDVDESYILEFYFPVPDVDTKYKLLPNGATTGFNAGGGYSGLSHPATSNNITETFWYLSRYATQSNNRTIAGVSTIQALSGKARSYQLEAAMGQIAGTNIYTETAAGFWNDTTTNITTLEITSTTTDDIKSGAKFKLFRRTSQNLRADAANSVERQATAVVSQGDATEVEYTLGRANFVGSAVALGVSLDDTVSAGTLTAKLKVDGVTVLTTTLDSTNNPIFNRIYKPIGIHKIGSGEEISTSITTTGSFATTGGGDRGVVLTATTVNEALIQPPSGGKVHLETIRIANTAQTSVTFEGLDGDVDGVYVIEAVTTPANSAKDVIIRPNGATSTYDTYSQFISAAGVGEVAATNGFNTPNSDSTMIRSASTVRIMAKSGIARMYLSHGYHHNSTDNWMIVCGGHWTDTSSNITSLVITSDVTSGLGVGSEYRLYKLTEGDKVTVL